MAVYLLLLMTATSLTVGHAHTPGDCEVTTVSGEELKMPLKESLFISFWPASEVWEAFLTIHDDTKQCLFDFKKSDKGSGVTYNCSNNDRGSFLKVPDEFFTDRSWKDVFITAQRSSPTSILLGFVLSSSVASCVYEVTSELHPPLQARWSPGASTKVVLNCPDKRCLSSYRELEDRNEHALLSFYVRGGENRGGVRISFTDSEDDIQLDSTHFSRSTWRRVVVISSECLRVWVDGRQIITATEDSDGDGPAGVALQTVDGGQLSWCSPRLPQGDCVERSLGVVLGLAVALALSLALLLALCLALKVRRSSPAASLTRDASLPAPITHHTAGTLPAYRPRTPEEDEVTPPDQPRSASPVSEHVYEAVDLIEAGRGSVHDEVNSLYKQTFCNTGDE